MYKATFSLDLSLFSSDFLTYVDIENILSGKSRVKNK